MKHFLHFGFLLLMGSLLSAQQETYRVAYDNGHQLGLEAGRSDRDDQRPFDFANKRAYQMADDGYQAGVHDRDVYIVAFKRGFEDGYEVGYGLQTQQPQPGPETVSAGEPRPEPRTLPRPDVSADPIIQRVIIPGVLPRGTQFDVKLLDSLGTDRNQRGERFRVEVAEDVRAGTGVVVPRGAMIFGEISHLKRAGRIKGRSEITLQFHELEMPGGKRYPLEAVVVGIEERTREEVKDQGGTIEGRGTKSEDAKQVGTASGIGALIGILTGGGKKGAGTGAVIGGIAGTVGVLASRGEDILLFSETELTIQLKEELRIE